MSASNHVQRWTESGGSLHTFDRVTDFNYYQSIPGWFDFDDIYDHAIGEAQDGAKFVEIGCSYGRSTAYLASRVANSKKRITIYAVDVWLGYLIQRVVVSVVQRDPVTNQAQVVKYEDQQIPVSVFPEFLSHMVQAGLIDIIVPLRMPSTSAARIFEDNSIDFCFIDADHAYEAVKEDLHSWYPKIRPGGLIAGHDYGGADPGVKRAVDEFFSSVTVSRSSWAVRKLG
jgi:hypothetical protein